MKFGISQFGTAQFGGDPYGLGPSAVLDIMINSMSEFLQSNGKYLKSIERFTVPIESPETLDLITKNGSPAIYVSYDGSTYVPDAIDGLTMVREMNFSVVCVCSNWKTRKSRFENRTIYEPNLDNMSMWAVNRITRALWSSSAMSNFVPKEERYIHYSPEFIISVVTFSGTTCIDFFDGDAGDELYVERVGIVHTPNDLNQLFDPDNQTPNTEDDTSADPGVFTV